MKIASEPDEFEQIHRLNHLTFVEEIPRYASVDGVRLVDRFHDENVYVVALQGRRLAGMLAIREKRPFSLDERLPGLSNFLPAGRRICEIRLLAVSTIDRGGCVLMGLMTEAWRYCQQRRLDTAIISATTRQLHLYSHLGFEPFGPRVGTPAAEFQPMILTRDRFIKRVGRALYRAERRASKTGRDRFA